MSRAPLVRSLAVICVLAALGCGEEPAPGSSRPEDVEVTRGALSAGRYLTIRATPLASISAGMSPVANLDWAHWGLGNVATAFNHQDGVTPTIGTYTRIGSAPVQAFQDGGASFSWQEGTPTWSVDSTGNGVQVCGAGNGFSFTIASEALTKRVRVYMFAQGAQAKLSANFDGATSTDTSIQSTGFQRFVYDVDFATPTSGALLKLSTTVNTVLSAQTGCIGLMAALVYPASTTPLPAGWSTQAIGANGLAGVAAYQSKVGTFQLDAAGANISGSSDNAFFAYRTLSGDGEISARVTGLSGGASGAKQGVMIRAGLGADASNVFLYQLPGNKLGYSRRASTGSGGYVATPFAANAFHFVKLVRKGNAISAYTSPYGFPDTWTLYTSYTLSNLGSVAYFGLAATSGSTTALVRGYSDNVRVAALPDPYTTFEVGATGATGRSNYDYATGKFTVLGAGVGLSAPNDALHLAYRSVRTRSGGDITARLVSVQSAGAAPVGGVTVRTNVGSGSSYAAIYRTPGGALTFKWRSTSGGAPSSKAVAAMGATPWVYLSWSGKTVYAYVAPDGASWQSVGSATLSDLGDDANPGLFSASGTSGTTTTAVFDNVAVDAFDYQKPAMAAHSENFYVSRESFVASDPDVLEGCVTPGTHDLLRFDFYSENAGRTDAVVGLPIERPDLFVWSKGHGHFHFAGYNLHQLKTSSGVVAVGRKESFCLEDMYTLDPSGASHQPLAPWRPLDAPWASPDGFYDCAADQDSRGLQGISAGQADLYAGGLPCQYLVVDGLAAGDYTFTSQTNANHFVVQETDGWNVFNAQLHIRISNPPTPGDVVQY
jgi:hypothetical protein